MWTKILEGSCVTYKFSYNSTSAAIKVAYQSWYLKYVLTHILWTPANKPKHFKSSHQRCFIKRVFLKLNRKATALGNISQEKTSNENTCIPMNFEKFLRTTIFAENLPWLCRAFYISYCVISSTFFYQIRFTHNVFKCYEQTSCLNEIRIRDGSGAAVGFKMNPVNAILCKFFEIKLYYWRLDHIWFSRKILRSYFIEHLLNVGFDWLYRKSFFRRIDI